MTLLVVLAKPMPFSWNESGTCSMQTWDARYFSATTAAGTTPPNSVEAFPRPFTYISQVFLPYIQREGIHQETIRMLTESNPFRAFAR